MMETLEAEEAAIRLAKQPPKIIVVRGASMDGVHRTPAKSVFDGPPFGDRYLMDYDTWREFRDHYTDLTGESVERGPFEIEFIPSAQESQIMEGT